VDAKSISSHQFGFRPQHGTVEQTHRIVHKINDKLDNKRFCTAAFIDISQAFDKVWHTGLLYKFKLALSHPSYTILKSYLMDRMFQVLYQEEYTPLYAIHSGVPQGSILGPILYSLYIADLPETELTLTATYADDMAILAPHHNPVAATKQLQYHLCRLEQWLKRWRMRAKETKSTHVTFTLRREDCPAVYLNGKHILQDATVKYLGIDLDRRLTWKTPIFTKRKQLGLLFQRTYWILGRKSDLSLANKVLLYKTILKPVWTYGLPL
jgi:hypothetical protein